MVRERGVLHRWGIHTHAHFHSDGSRFGGAPYLSYLLCRSFSIWGSTVVHRSSFHRELERQLSMMPSASPDHPTPPPPRGYLRFLVDNVQKVHDHRQVIDGHCRVHRCLQTSSIKRVGWDGSE